MPNTLLMSPRKYSMLKMFASQNITNTLSETDAATFRQDTFRSMLYQKWVEHDGHSGFHITQSGRDALRIFEHGEIVRKTASLTLTSFFKPPKQWRRKRAYAA